MTLRELHERISKRLATMDPRLDEDVMVATSEPGTIGRRPCVPVGDAGSGIDWEGGLFLIHPTERLKKCNPRPKNPPRKSGRSSR